MRITSSSIQNYSLIGVMLLSGMVMGGCGEQNQPPRELEENFIGRPGGNEDPYRLDEDKNKLTPLLMEESSG